MSTFLELAQQTDQRLDAYAARLYRINAHLRRGELRAARARFDGMELELAELTRALELPSGFMLAGAQVGFFAGKGRGLRGRLAGVAFGVIGGWLVGQSTLVKKRRDAQELLLASRQIARELARQEG